MRQSILVEHVDHVIRCADVTYAYYHTYVVAFSFTVALCHDQADFDVSQLVPSDAR